MDVARLVAHEVELVQRNGDRLGADAEKAADIIDDGVASIPVPSIWSTVPTFSSSTS